MMHCVQAHTQTWRQGRKITHKKTDRGWDKSKNTGRSPVLSNGHIRLCPSMLILCKHMKLGLPLSLLTGKKQRCCERSLLFQIFSDNKTKEQSSLYKWRQLNNISYCVFLALYITESSVGQHISNNLSHTRMQISLNIQISVQPPQNSGKGTGVMSEITVAHKLCWTTSKT